MNKRVYVATMMALLSMSVNGYAVDMTTNQNQESSNVINVTANRTALPRFGHTCSDECNYT